MVNPHYNDLFFHPIVCNVCKWLNDGNTFFCKCGLVSYCSPEHMEEDREGSDGRVGHSGFCDAILELIAERKLRNFDGRVLLNVWTSYRYAKMGQVLRKLARNLLPHEIRIMMSMRHCNVCYKEIDLMPCPECFCVDYCMEHFDRPIRPHNCAEFKKWLFTETEIIYTKDCVLEWRSLHTFPDSRWDVKDMYSFFKTHVLPARHLLWSILDIAFSDYLSGPLTVYHGLQRSQLIRIPMTKSTYVIHVIMASDEIRREVQFWEYFLHVFTHPTKLIVVIVGLELSEESHGSVPLCLEKCAGLHHEFQFECHRMSYGNYVKSNSYRNPNVIVGLHMIPPNWETWVKLKKWFYTDCPVVLTYINMKDMKKNAWNIKMSFSKEPIRQIMNTFKGFKLHRNYRTGEIYHRNEYIQIYRNLLSI
ncbi:PREDICTED: uncharacterized protein LOC106745325 [Dinoponera quadriceps]|uniref:Uncharacterized protein LOC106745325 n=1 Tax=Dinoponera quadriceps TaxID=609295 RepID=A0A6P3XDK0_DINQU|nr:PREDICTED: uncharacterized protein LOC106745325 [Dinoponera quadriceps]